MRAPIERLGGADRRIAVPVALLALVVLLLPVFAGNVLRSADQTFFANWDRESQALVLARVEQARAGTAPTWGLTRAEPDLFAPYSTFDAGAAAAPAAVYTPYESQLGLQGLAFSVLDAAGCSSIGCLTTVEASLFTVVLVAFLLVLAMVSRRSLAVTALVVAVLSPWIVASARNLYWVPWTWLLPAVAAGVFTLARGRGSRRAAGIALFLAVALKAACGYEFITSVIALALAMPVLATLFGRIDRRRAARDAGAVLAIATVAFVVMVGAHAIEAGGGSLVDGVQAIVADATRRTYGPARAGLDQGTVDSLRVSPLAVLGIYVFGWQTDLLDIGVGTRFALTVGRWGLPALLVAAAVAVVATAALRDRRWRRDLVLLLVLAAPPVSWFVLGKSHAYSAVAMCFVLWYWLAVPAGIWIVGATVGRLLAPRLRAARAARAA